MAGQGAIRVQSGDCSVTVGPELGAALEYILDTAYGELVKAMRGAAEDLAEGAEAAWYAQVQRRTGQSGRLETGIVVGPNHVKAVIRSMDTRTTKKGKPVVFYVHRPGPNSTIQKRLSFDEYTALMKAFRQTGRVPEGFEGKAGPHGPIALKKKAPNPKASDGRYLVPELLTKPGRLRALRLAAELGPQIASAARRG